MTKEASDNQSNDQSLALAAALAATTAAQELIRFAREGDNVHSPFGDVEVLEQLLDAAKMVFEIEGFENPARAVVYHSICQLLEGWAP